MDHPILLPSCPHPPVLLPTLSMFFLHSPYFILLTLAICGGEQLNRYVLASVFASERLKTSRKMQQMSVLLVLDDFVDPVLSVSPGSSFHVFY